MQHLLRIIFANYRNCTHNLAYFRDFIVISDMLLHTLPGCRIAELYTLAVSHTHFLQWTWEYLGDLDHLQLRQQCPGKDARSRNTTHYSWYIGAFNVRAAWRNISVRLIESKVRVVTKCAARCDTNPCIIEGPNVFLALACLQDTPTPDIRPPGPRLLYCAHSRRSVRESKRPRKDLH